MENSVNIVQKAEKEKQIAPSLHYSHDGLYYHRPQLKTNQRTRTHSLTVNDRNVGDDDHFDYVMRERRPDGVVDGFENVDDSNDR